MSSDDNTEECMTTRPDNCVAAAESVATITGEDVDKFDYNRAFDWLEDNDADPGNLQSLPELREFIKSYLTKYESRVILSKVRNEEVGLPANVTDSVATITVEDVNKFDYDKAFDWLEENDVDPGNLQSLPELIKFIKSHITQAKSREDLSEVGKDVVVAPAGVTGGGEALMTEILVRDKQMKQGLSEVYRTLLRFVSQEMLTDELKDWLSKLYPDYESTLVRHNSELVNDECPIVVTGETSAGKSSLLNLLLGTDVLPHSLLCATATICRLHYCKDKRVEIESCDGDIKTIPLDESDQTSEALHKRLKPYISSMEMRFKNPYKNVDIYWPLPLLQDSVTIVDTPGIGEDAIGDEITNRLMSYLPNAVAFIYVINSSNSGGLQDDRLLHILDVQRGWEQEGKLATFDPSCSIFVCNWWDQVTAKIKESPNEEAKVWNYTVEALGKYGVKESQIFKMSTTEAARYYKLGMGTTEMFQNLLNGIERMVPQSLEAKVRRHSKWLGKFLEELRRVVASRINRARDTEDEKKKFFDEITQRLRKLRMDADKVREKLVKLAESRCIALEEELFQHLHQEDVRARLSSWNELDLADIGTGDMEVTRFNADKKIAKRVKDELVNWEQEHDIIKNLSTELAKEFLEEFKLLGQECSRIDMMIEGSPNWEYTAEAMRDGGAEDKEGTVFSTGEKVILGVASPLWIPLVAAAAVLFLPVGIGMVIREQLKDKSEREKFMKNKLMYLQNWTKEHFEKVLKRESLHDFVTNVYYKQFEKKIDEVCRQFIPTQISADQRLMIDIAKDQRTSREIYNQFLPIQNKLKKVLAKHQLYSLLYESKDYIEMKNVKEVRRIGHGNFSDVYLVKLKQDNKEVDAAMKVLRRALESPEEMYTQLSELDSLRKLRHRNIVEFRGVSYADVTNTDVEEQYGSFNETPAATLKFFFEYCNDTLENVVFNNESLKCKKYKSVETREPAFKYYITMATGICEGLAIIHEKKYVHRDLKLSNVLVKTGVPKICDLGFSRQELFMTGTFVGTISHMAPEVIDQKSYDSSADIYSLGILLWELWYGRHAYSEEMYKSYSLPNLFDLIRTGERPLFSYKYCPVDPLKVLIMECWNKSRSERPSANRVKDTLQKIFKDFHCQDSTETETLYQTPSLSSLLN